MSKLPISRKMTPNLKGAQTPDTQPVAAKPDYPRFVYTLFFIFTLYLTLPLVEVPLLGLSISAPVFFLVAMPVLLQSQPKWMGKYSRWIGMAIWIWLSIFLSAIINGLESGGRDIDSGSITALIQFAYWFIVFVVSAYLMSSQKTLAERIVGAIATGIALLGVLRLGEAAFGGAIGAWTRLRLMSQNGYAIQFSMFYPILLAFAFQGANVKKARIAAIIVLAAILINGSRAGWAAAFASTAVFFFIYFGSQKQYARTASTLFILFAMLWIGILLAPQSVKSAFTERLATVERLEEDKSYAIRQLMIQRGIRLFQTNPLAGVGVSRWYKESVTLKIPQILRYGTKEYFERKSSHNSYISYLAETGIIGAIPLGVLLLTLLIGGYRAASHLSRQGKTWAIGIYAGFIGMSIHLWALAGLTGTVSWFVYGLTAAIIEIDRQAREKESQEQQNASRLSLSRSRRF